MINLAIPLNTSEEIYKLLQVRSHQCHWQIYGDTEAADPTSGLSNGM